MADSPKSAGTTSLADLLTALKNLVLNVGSLAQNYLNVEGLSMAAGITAATVLKPAPGRVGRVSVIVAGSASGFIYDSPNLQSTARPLYVIPMTVGVFDVRLPANYGVAVVPGTGQTVSVSWS